MVEDKAWNFEQSRGLNATPHWDVPEDEREAHTQITSQWM